jgi:hypothetical protein
METAAPLHAPDDAAGAGAISIADDRLEGAAAIGQIIAPHLPDREVRRMLVRGGYPHWHEGRLIVASKAALLAHYRAKAGAALAAPPTGERPPQNRSDARGHLGSRKGNGADAPRSPSRSPK